MSSSNPDILVLRQKAHGKPATELSDAIRARLPDHEVTLARTPEQERSLIGDVDVAVGIDLPAGVREATSGLDLFACVYAGTGHLDIETLRDQDTAVTNASGVHGPNIGEYVVGSMVLFARRFRQAWRQQDRREWRSFQTTEVKGSTVTVVGLGSIGSAVVDRLQGFDVNTIGVRYTPSKGGPTDEVFGFDQIHQALAKSDYVVLACPLTDTTADLIDKSTLRSMPPHSVLINIARGGVVDTDALVGALRSNAIGGAALDVTDPEPLPEDHPLWGFDNVQITPHNAGHTPAYYERVADILADNLDRIETDGFDNLRNQVV
ncbi:MAG: phosphoglycerate dehydrogenase related dehydrogenase [uncultured archaeon A07HR60]|nr:MAG: phosphoglycerate dehydrogenase related dehydrogenase [uncultured archaeon A07HR60]